MAKKQKEEVVEQTVEQPRVDDTVEKIKVKKKPTMKKLSQDDEPFKVDLNKPLKTKADAVQESETNASDAIVGESEDSKSSEKGVEEVRDTKEQPRKNEDTV